MILLLNNVNAYKEITPHQFSKHSCIVRMFDMTGVDSLFEPSLTHPHFLNQTPLFSKQTKILIGGWMDKYGIIEGSIIIYNLGNYQSFYQNGTMAIIYDINTPQEIMNIFYLTSFPKTNICTNNQRL